MGREEDRPDSDEAHAPSESKLKLAISDRLIQVFNVVSEHSFDQEAVFKRARMVMDKERPVPAENLPGFLAEMHVSSVIEKYALANQGVLTLDPVLNLDTTENYLFERTSTGTFSVRRKNDAGKIAEYDRIIMIDDMPVVVEVKSGYSAKGANGAPGETLSELIKPVELIRRFAPLQELFPYSTQFGFVVVGSQEAMGPHGERKINFGKKGVLLTSLPLSTPDLEEQSKIFRTEQVNNSF